MTLLACHPDDLCDSFCAFHLSIHPITPSVPMIFLHPTESLGILLDVACSWIGLFLFLSLGTMGRKHLLGDNRGLAIDNAGSRLCDVR
jgi:hypothetical protein